MKVTVVIESDLTGERDGKIEITNVGCTGQEDIQQLVLRVLNSWEELQKEETK